MLKVGWVRYRNSRIILGEIKNVTVSQKCGKWYVSVETEFETEIPTLKGGEVGIDIGVVRFATLLDGQFFEPINAKDNRQTQANFECVACGYQNNADVVGAIKALKCGQEILASQ